MKIYESIDTKYIKQTDIIENKKINLLITEKKPINIFFDFSITKTIFDYEVNEQYPPCANFLENFLESIVMVFSLPIDHNLFDGINLKDLYEQKIQKYDGTPKNIIENEFVVGWVGVEKDKNIFLISNIQINGIIFKNLKRSVAKALYKSFLKFVEEEFGENIIIPTHETLRTLVKRLRYHPRSSIMETPYTSQVIKGYKKQNFIIDGPCRQYLSKKEMIFWTKKNIK